MALLHWLVKKEISFLALVLFISWQMKLDLFCLKNPTFSLFPEAGNMPLG